MLIPFNEKKPTVHDTVFLAPGVLFNWRCSSW